MYLNGYATMGELLIGLTKYFVLYNGERAPQALVNQTPDAVRTSSVGGGAMIVDKHSATLDSRYALLHGHCVRASWYRK